ncbi:MAG: GGDEF domain-containing protein [Rhodobacterales bacterium]
MTPLTTLPTSAITGEIYDNSTLNTVLPLHAQLNAEGEIIHTGPTLAKLLAQTPGFIGKPLTDLIRFTHPEGIETGPALAAYFGQPLRAQIKDLKGFDLKAVAAPLPGNSGFLVNFAFGKSLKDAVAHWQLTSADFSPADPSTELLYVIEVQSVLLEESRSLNDRLNGQREAAEEQAYTDPLTGLSNRRALDRYIKRLCRRRVACEFAIFLIDLDHFKSVNDTLGHAAGDRVLRQVAEILLNETRPTDIVVRTGGDEFVLVLQDTGDRQTLEMIVARIIGKIERPVIWQGQKCYVGASIGIKRCHTKDNKSIEYHLQAADEALYASKNGGRGTYRFVE